MNRNREVKYKDYEIPNTTTGCENCVPFFQCALAGGELLVCWMGDRDGVYYYMNVNEFKNGLYKKYYVRLSNSHVPIAETQMVAELL